MVCPLQSPCCGSSPSTWPSSILTYAGGRLPQLQQTAKSDHDILQEQYRFIRSAEDDADDSWEARQAKSYYAKLYREYAIIDLSQYKVGCCLRPCDS